MRKFFFLFFVVSFLLIPRNAASQAPSPATLVIEGGTLIDGNGGPPVQDALVIIQGNKIATVSRKGQVTYPSTAQVLRADGKFILPGLWEAETVYAWFGGEASLAHGVTSVSDIGVGGEVLAVHREAVNRGKIGGPRLFTAVGYLSGSPGTGFESPLSPNQVPKSVDEAREITKRLLAVDAAMIMFQGGGHPVEFYEAVIKEAHQAGKSVMLRPGGPRMFPQNAALADADIISHSDGIDVAIAKTPLKWRNELDVYSEIDEAKAADLIQLLVREGVILAPTLIRKGKGFHRDRVQFEEEDRRWWLSNPALHAYYPAQMVQSVLLQYRPTGLDTAVWERRNKGYQNLLRFHRQFVQAGGRLIAGGNSPSNCTPGLCLHQELAVFEEAGLTPMQMIQSASKWPAEAFRVSDQLGTVEPGKLADLVIVNADPLESIGNLRNIQRVVYDGKVQDLTYHSWYSSPFRGSPGLGGNPVVEDLEWAVALRAATFRDQMVGAGAGAGPEPVRVPPPGIETISPYIVTEGSSTFTLKITGFNFFNSSQVYFEGSLVPSRRVSATELEATLEEDQLKRAGRFSIVVKNPGPLIVPGWRSEDGTSNKAYLLVKF